MCKRQMSPYIGLERKYLKVIQIQNNLYILFPNDERCSPVSVSDDDDPDGVTGAGAVSIWLLCIIK